MWSTLLPELAPPKTRRPLQKRAKLRKNAPSVPRVKDPISAGYMHFVKILLSLRISFVALVILASEKILWAKLSCHILRGLHCFVVEVPLRGYIDFFGFVMADDKDKALDAALRQIERSFGKGSAMKLGQREAIEIDSIPTGSLGLDIALGIGGFPKGRIVEIYGPESSGKTTLALHAIANSQTQGGNCAFIDAEHALDPVYAKKLNIDINNLVISQPDTGEQALEIADTLVRSGAIDVLVVDSVAALVPKAELEGDMGDSHMGLQARLMSQALRKLTGSISRTNCMVIFINQIRQKIGVMFGNPETTTGGNALKFYASVRIDIRRIGSIKDKDQMLGNQTRIKVVKNKLAPPFKVVEFDVMYGAGVSRTGELIDLGVSAGIVEKAGSWYSFGANKLGQGRESAKSFLEGNPKIADEIEKMIKANSGLVADHMIGYIEQPSNTDEVEA
jgi:recombination protein RecA